MPDANEPESFKPFVSPSESPPEFTWPSVLTGAFLGTLFGASSLYLVLKVGLTVSASVPIAVLSITLFRVFSKALKVRNATILENNIVQTTGSAGESIAFGVGVTMPALFLLGFEMDPWRVMTVSVLGGILGILMMIPLRRAFIVKQHGKLIYPEGTACAEVLEAGERGGSTAKMVFVGFGIAFVYKFLNAAGKLWASEPSTELSHTAEDGTKSGLKGAELTGELSPELLGVGYLIGPRIACLMMAGAMLSYFVLGPAIATFGASASEPILPATRTFKDESAAAAVVGPGLVHVAAEGDTGLIRNMGPAELKSNYLRYIGAGAVAAGGIISMIRALPLIFGSIVGGLRDLRSSRGGPSSGPRTDRDLPIWFVLVGSVLLVMALAAVPQLGLGLNANGLLAATLVLLFGFLFVTVSSRLTGEVGSSSNPISGMTIATLLLTCSVFLLLDKRDAPAMLMALTIASVVCIASSNGGTTSQDLKTGYLVGATPYKQQWAILVGAITSALVIGMTMLALNAAGTHYTKKNLPQVKLVVTPDAAKETPGKPYTEDKQEYFVVHVREREIPDVAAGRYLCDADGTVVYRTDLPISRREDDKTMDNGEDAPARFTAPQPALFANIIQGILGGDLEWGLVIFGALIAVSLELAGVPALPVAVGMYLPLGSSTPIFIGGLLRFVTDRMRGKAKSDAESETSPGVLLASGYIAGGTLCGLMIAFFAFSEDLTSALNFGLHLFGTVNESGKKEWKPDSVVEAKVVSLVAFGLLGLILLVVGARRSKPPSA